MNLSEALTNVQTDEDAIRVINVLFGFREEYLRMAVNELGALALSERALILIAKQQLREEFTS